MDPAQALEAREIARHRVINETIARGDSRVQKFYSGAVVFLTGASGFLGKHLIEKLFRSCRIKKLYILMRSKKQKTIRERLSYILDDEVYAYLKETQPDFEGKVVPLEGDMSLPGLGMSDKDLITIIDEVNIIFHGAATVNFSESLKKATLTNVSGTTEMLQLAKKCKKLRSFVHISTAYTHATLQRESEKIEEQFFESPMSAEALIQLVKGTDERILDVMTPQIIKGWPNTYAFTKAVAEDAVRTMAEDLPVCIVRPSIVICAYREPLPGWIDKSAAYGPSGFVVGSGLGVLHLIFADDEVKLDLVPVDIVNNAVIVAAHETVARRARGLTDTKIYTVCSNRNSIKFGTVVDLITTEGRNYSTMSSIWYGFAITIRNKLLYNVLFFLMHTLPGYMVDGALKLAGKKPILSEVYNKIRKFGDVLGYYLIHTWHFDNSNLCDMYWGLSPADRTIFNCNIDGLDWKLYMVLWCIGCRKYVIKDGLKDTKQAIKKQFMFRILHYFFTAAYLFMIYKVMSVSFNAVALVFSICRNMNI